jgi:hypothetical protein
VPSLRQASAKPAAPIVNATAKTRLVIEDLQARLTADTRETRPTEPEHHVNGEESFDELERQLQAYFERSTPKSSRTRNLDELRSRVIDGVVDRIIMEWAGPEPRASLASGIGPEVVERLIERVLEGFGKGA